MKKITYPKGKWISPRAADYLRELSERVASLESLDDLDREVIRDMLRNVAGDVDPREDYYVGPGVIMEDGTRSGRSSVTSLRAEIALYVELQLDRGEKLSAIKARLRRLKLTEDQIRRVMSLRKTQRRYLNSLSVEVRAELDRGEHPFSPDMATIRDRMRKNEK